MSVKKEATTRTLDLTIQLNEEDFSVVVSEPESGESTTIVYPFTPDDHRSFDQDIGKEIYSWLSLWKDEEEDNYG